MFTSGGGAEPMSESPLSVCATSTCAPLRSCGLPPCFVTFTSAWSPSVPVTVTVPLTPRTKTAGTATSQAPRWLLRAGVPTASGREPNGCPTSGEVGWKLAGCGWLAFVCGYAVGCRAPTASVFAPPKGDVPTFAPPPEAPCSKSCVGASSRATPTAAPQRRQNCCPANNSAPQFEQRSLIGQ